MALATFKLNECHGTNAATESDSLKAPNFLSADVNESDPAVHPIAIPATGVDPDNNSYEKWLRLELTAQPDNQVDNFKVWGPNAAPGTGLTIYMGTTGTPATPINSASIIAATLQHTNYFSGGTGLVVDVEPGAGFIAAVGEKTDHFILQLRVTSAAPSGSIPTAVFYVQYEES